MPQKFKVIDHSNDGNTKVFSSRANAEEKAKLMREDFHHEVSIEPVSEDNTSGSQDVEVVDDEQPEPKPEPTQADADALDEAAEAVDKLQKNVDTDPLDVLPSYMITMVDGKPSLNKRGVSVLAYHYGIDVQERNVVTYPHENGYETAVVEFLVEGEDGRTFSGIGEAHVDETPKHQLLRMAETRAYKRSVIFATGTGIVGYNEIVESLE